MGHSIIANMGDQMSDLDGGFAEKTFKLPTPLLLHSLTPLTSGPGRRSQLST